ncbi:MAG: hypothetical protein JW991_03965 [Candidatus Pacebacteria bacterium]|nr:hypothetical protein [Candidatus Paceibacterota bacterium]
MTEGDQGEPGSTQGLFARSVDQIRESLPPGKEYLAGLAISAAITAVLSNSPLLPPSAEPHLRVILDNPLPGYLEAFGVIGLGTGLALAVDGARRIAFETLPLLKLGTKMFWEKITDKKKH